MDCAVTEVSPAPNLLFKWEYLGNPQGVGVGPSMTTWQIQYYYNGQAIPADHGGSPTFSMMVFKVTAVDVAPPGKPACEDIVSEVSNLFYYPSGTHHLDWDSISGDYLDGSGNVHNSRQLLKYFRVWGPVQCGGDFTGIKVGFTQTVAEESQLGTVTYHRSSQNNNPPGTQFGNTAPDTC